jgi:oxalate decarboxylase
MAEFQRRDFLSGAVAFAAATAASLTQAGRVAAGDPSFMNNVPDPLLAGKELPTFKFALEKSEGKVVGKSSGKEATVLQLPISKGLAGVSMRLEPGAMWYFPRGHGHMLECLGNKSAHFVLIFDNGYFSEFGTFSITDWIGHTPKALLAKNFGLPESAFDGFPKDEVYFAQGPIPPEKITTPLQGLKLPPLTHKYQLLAQQPHGIYKGGREWRVDSSKFPISKTVTGVVLDLEPGALRELHWHPNTDEWQYVIEGQISVTMFGSHGRYRTETMEKGVLIGFNTGTYETIDLSQWIAGNPADVLATNFSKPAALFEKFPHKDVFIAGKDGPEKSAGSAY